MPVNYLTETIVSTISCQNIFTVIETWSIFAYFTLLYIPGLTGIIYGGNSNIYLPPLIYLTPTLLCVIFGIIFSQTQNEYLAFPASVLSFLAFITDVVALSMSISGLSNCLSNQSAPCNFESSVAVILALIIFLFLIIFALCQAFGYIKYSVSIDTNLQYIKMAQTAYNETQEEIKS